MVAGVEQALSAARGTAQELGIGEAVAGLKRLFVPHAEPRDGHVVGELVAGQDPEGEVLVAVPLDLSGGAHPDRVGIQQDAEQGLGVVGGVAVPVSPIAAQEWVEVELVDHVEDEPGEVAVGQPVAQVGGPAGRAGRGRSAGSCRPRAILSIRGINTKYVNSRCR
jgi:hypothetical protein